MQDTCDIVNQNSLMDVALVIYLAKVKITIVTLRWVNCPILAVTTNERHSASQVFLQISYTNFTYALKHFARSQRG